MKTYIVTTAWKIIGNPTCRELVDQLKTTRGNLTCVGGDFIVTTGDAPTPIRDAWAWIQHQHPNKRLVQLEELTTTYKLRDQ